MTRPLASRAARHVFGKRTVPKHTKLSDETSDILAQLARSANKSESDFIATLIEIRCHGINVVESINRYQLEIVSGKAPLPSHEVGVALHPDATHNYRDNGGRR